MNGAARAKVALGARLRELRQDAGLDGRQLSTAAGWHWSKTSRIEHGKQMPSESDLAVWCRVCDATLALPDLVAALRNVRAQWAEWRRITAAGHTRRQQRGRELESETRELRIYNPTIVPGLLQTEPYARAVLAQCIGFLGTLDDLDTAVLARMSRQNILRTGGTRVAVLINEAALHTTLGDDEVMAGQLRHLLYVAFGNPRLHFGIVPLRAEFVYLSGSFHLFDRRQALIETASAELTITAPSELELYERLWGGLHTKAVYGDAARALIANALDGRTGGVQLR
ncbi:helix-turn-helix domain-containing protein [Nocardia coffeae]|uniref:helix-turn-helix domain-containing protein n=1 Tax=Nocardia coffeae TaxID=2873381 RepID=UPI0027E17330|nr:helix-turn-helix transcriptional regulator [Nocardia coffeae]